METSDWIAVGSAGIALLALIVAIVVVVRQHGLSSRMTEIEEARRAEEVDEKQTAVIGISREPDEYGFYVVLTNEGAAVAEAVELSAWSEKEAERTILDERTVKTPRLYPGDQKNILATPVISQSPPYGYLLTWTDGRGPQEKRGHL